MKMADENKKVLVLDDEPHVLEWLQEYLESKGCQVVFAVNIQEAVQAINSGHEFRMMILDLNVPASGEFSEILKSKGPAFENYRGLYIAEQARTMGYRGPQVIVYSVHDLDEIRLVTERIGVTYVTKGRPRAFKSEIDNVLSYDPTERSGGKL
jgi:CheY-like chemotaxis protein